MKPTHNRALDAMAVVSIGGHFGGLYAGATDGWPGAIVGAAITLVAIYLGFYIYPSPARIAAKWRQKQGPGTGGEDAP